MEYRAWLKGEKIFTLLQPDRSTQGLKGEKVNLLYLTRIEEIFDNASIGVMGNSFTFPPFHPAPHPLQNMTKSEISALNRANENARLEKARACLDEFIQARCTRDETAMTEVRWFAGQAKNHLFDHDCWHPKFSSTRRYSEYLASLGFTIHRRGKNGSGIPFVVGLKLMGTHGRFVGLKKFKAR